VVLETARHLRARGVDARVLTTGPSGLREHEGIPTDRLPIPRYAFNLAFPQVAARAASCDLVQTFTYHGCLPAWIGGRLLGKPVVCQVLGLFRDAWLEMAGPIRGRLWRGIEAYLVRRPYARVLFISEYSRREGLALGVRPERAALTEPGIDLAAYRADLPKTHDVLFVGKLDARKGIQDVLEVARALPGLRFRAHGWGPENEAIRRSAPPNLALVPFEGGAPLREAFARARVFLFPSRAETFGIAIVEAMASGCAVVSSVPLEYAGARVRPGDIPAMVEAVSRLSADPAEAARLGARNAALAQAYTWDRYTDQLLAVYDEVLRSSRRGPTERARS